VLLKQLYFSFFSSLREKKTGKEKKGIIFNNEFWFLKYPKNIYGNVVIHFYRGRHKKII